MKRLILVEGLPGTGKTTMTQRIAQRLAAKGEAVTALYEGDERIPCDFYEMAGIPLGEFEAFRAEHLNVEDARWVISLRTASYVYLRLDRCADFAADAFRKWDMGDERNLQASVAHYVPCALERLDAWVDSYKDSGETVVIDSGFLQNPINELLFRGASDDEACSFVQGILHRFGPLHPVCVYLQRESAEAAVSFAKQAKGSDWASRVEALLAELNCPDLFARRYALEQKLLPLLPHILCPVRGADWSGADREIERLFV